MDRVLKTISSHLRGEISTDIMMNAYDIILREEYLKVLKEDMRIYTDEGLALVGLGKAK